MDGFEPECESSVYIQAADALVVVAASEQTGEEFNARYNAGMLYREDGMLAQASEQFMHALKLKPDEVRMISELALLKQDQGAVQEACKLH